MSNQQIEKLIINSPYEEPTQYWQYVRETRTFSLEPGRRPAGYVVATPQSKGFDDPGVFVPIELVNAIRPRIKDWRARGYPGVTGITKRLLDHWQDQEERHDRRFFFCQLEAIETLIWLTEGPEAEKTGITIPTDGGDFSRWCCKMATGQRQNHCHGHADRLACAEQGSKPAGQPFFQKCAGYRPRAYRQKPVEQVAMGGFFAPK